jgi:hypothetical protein
VHRELDREHGAERVRRVGQADRDVKDLLAHPEALRDHRLQREHRRGEHEKRDERAHDKATAAG